MSPEDAYEIDTRAEKNADGSFTAAVTDRWNALGAGPNGGYVLGIVLRALAQVVPFPDPLVVSAFFTRRADIGAAQILTETIREGRSVATAEARLLQSGEERVRAIASFTDLDAQTGETLDLSEPPDLPPPEECFDPLGGASFPGLTLVDRMEYRAPVLPGWTQGEPSGRPELEFWMKFRDRDADPLSLPLLVDAAAPAVMEIGAAGSSTIELTVHVRGKPAPGWLACRSATRHVIDGYHEEDFEIWDSEGKLVAQSRQLARLPRS